MSLYLPERAIPWNGGYQALADDVEVMYWLRDGRWSIGKVGELRWTHVGHDTDLVAYIVLEPKPESKGLVVLAVLAWLFFVYLITAVEL